MALSRNRLRIPPKTKRNREIYERRLAGETLKQLSEEFDVCPERIRVITIQEGVRIKFQERTRRRITGRFRPIDMGGQRDFWLVWDLVSQKIEFEHQKLLGLNLDVMEE